MKIHDRVNREVCSNCIYYKKRLNDQRNWMCIATKSIWTMYEFSQAPYKCPYKDLTHEEALTQQIAERLFK